MSAAHPIQFVRIPKDGEYELSIGPQVLKAFHAKAGELVVLSMVIGHDDAEADSMKRRRAT